MLIGNVTASTVSLPLGLVIIKVEAACEAHTSQAACTTGVLYTC